MARKIEKLGWQPYNHQQYTLKIMPHYLINRIVLKWNSVLKKINMKLSSIFIPRWSASPSQATQVTEQWLLPTTGIMAFPKWQRLFWFVTIHFLVFTKQIKKLINIETSILLSNLSENTKYYILFEEDWHTESSISFI